MVQHLLDAAPIEIEFEGDGAESMTKGMAGKAHANVVGYVG